jgi:hypothetical protein
MPITLDMTKIGQHAAAAVALLLLAACTVPQQTAAVPAGPIPPGAARIWFYRVYDPSLSRNIANVDLNGVRVVSVLPGDGPAYRDVPPGAYHIAPESFGVDANQTRDVTLAAGQEIFVKILDDPNLVSGGGGHTDFVRDTFYAWVMPPALAHAEMRM